MEGAGGLGKVASMAEPCGEHGRMPKQPVKNPSAPVPVGNAGTPERARMNQNGNQ
jgi:hypothetical protein